MNERIGVIGAGSWGTTLADLLARKGHEVTLWCYEPELVAEIRATGVNSRYLSEITLSPRLTCTNSLSDAVAAAGLVLFVSPTQVMRSVLGQALPYLPDGIPLVSASKGIELGTLLTMSQLFSQTLPDSRRREIAVLSGPSFAREVALGIPTTVVCASEQEATARLVQALFHRPEFRIYRSTDTLGVEFGGALKNVIAVGAGVGDGLGYGDNTKAGLVTRALAEIRRLGVACGAQPETFSGLSGLGDLMLTCFSRQSRNREFGERLGRGEAMAAIQASHPKLAEGYPTARSAYRLAREKNVPTPIIDEVHALLYEGKEPKLAVRDLISRAFKAED